MRVHSTKNSSMTLYYRIFPIKLILRMLYLLRVQMCRLHLSAVGAGIANSMLFFLHTANFSYGAKLVYDGEMKFDHVFRLSI